MKKLLIIFMLILFFLTTSFVLADTAEDLVMSHQFETVPTSTDSQATTDATGSGINLASGVGGTGNAWNFTSTNSSYANLTDKDFMTTITGSPVVYSNFWLKPTSFASESFVQYWGTGGGSNAFSIRVLTNGSIQANIRSNSADSSQNIDAGPLALNNWEMWTIEVNYPNDRLLIYRNETLIANNSATFLNTSFDANTFGSAPTNLRWGSDNALGGSANVVMDNYNWYNKSVNSADLTALYNAGLATLEITNSTWNMTSDGGCVSWASDQSVYCPTTDGTPSVTFDTARAASCSMSTSDETGYNASNICGTTGGSSHICTLGSGYALSFGTDNLYVQCDDGNINVTSGALAINMTAGSGGAGLVSCINIIGSGCAAEITNGCAAILSS